MDQHRPNKSRIRAVQDGKLVETANGFDYADFMQRFLGIDALAQLGKDIAYKTDRQVKVDLIFAEGLKSSDKDTLDACFSLIQESSAADYASSEMKWSTASKRKEMVLPDMRYLIVQEEFQEENSTFPVHQTVTHRILGFVSFMITYEDGFEVAYIYEIHLCDDLRGQGVGTLLLNMVEDVARRVDVEKCMLTVFKSNKKAVKWYERCGYTIDDFSPRPRVLRNGTIKPPTYLILSKPLSRLAYQ